MRTRITVLSSRPNAEFPWPCSGTMYDPDTNGQCCIGQHGRQHAGVPLHLLAIAFPLASRHPASWVDLWEQAVPDDVVREVGAVVGESLLGAVYHAGGLASHLNDRVACVREDPERAVAGLRILWRWLGETQGERWIIRWYRPPENGEAT